MTDWAQLYRDHVDAVGALATDLTDDELATIVPATPAWTVREVIAHLAGVPGRHPQRPDGRRPVTAVERAACLRADRAVRRRPRRGAPRQRRRDGGVGGGYRPARHVWNIVVHHADLHEALGRGEMAAPLWQPVLDAAAPYKLGEQAVTVYAGDAAYGGGGPEVTVPPYELFRALFSRRSRSQIAAWAGDAVDPDQVCVFGARDDDQPVP